MRRLIPLCAFLLIGSTAFSFVHQDATQWTEQCHTSTDRYYLSPKQIFKGLYANPNYKGQLLADAWVKVVPRTDTKEGQQEYENQLKELRKKAKDKHKEFSYRLAKMEVKARGGPY